MKKFAFGIDLGTTNSCIAVKTVGKPASIIKLADGRSTLASCVMYKDGEVVVGYEAYKHRYDVKHVVYSSKRDIGSDKTYTVYANGDDQPPIQVTPVDVAAEILKKLKHDAELIYGEGVVSEVTITVPAYFTPERRASTIKAAEQAGLEVLALINEPTAAAIAYTDGKFEPGQILVYDLGGGTFDVTLLEMLQSNSTVDSLFGDDSSDSIATVLTSSGNPRLGGDDIDYLTYIAAIEANKKTLAASIEGLPEDIDVASLVTIESKEELILFIEQNKKANEMGSFTSPIVLEYKGEQHTCQITVTTAEYESAFRKVYSQSIELVNQCLAGRDVSQISKIILIGGSTKLRRLRECMQQDFQQEIYTALNPDEAVALGAAVNSSVLYGETNMSITDILPQSIGMECYSELGSVKTGGRFKKLIAKDTPIPTSVTTIVRTIEPNQKSAIVPIYQGEDPVAANNSYVGYIQLDLKPTEHIQEIKVVLVVNASGVLQVKLASANSEASVVLQNILRPSGETKTAKDKLLTRYWNILSKYKNKSDIYDQGYSLLERLDAGNVEFSEVRAFFTDITKSEREALHDEVEKTSQFSRALNDLRRASSKDMEDPDSEE